MSSTRPALLALAVALLPGTPAIGVAPQALPGVKLRLVVVGSEERGAGGDASDGDLLADAESFERRTAEIDGLTDELLGWAGTLVLEDVGEAIDAAAVERLRRAVEGGTGLVVGAGAVATLAGSPAGADLIGLRAAAPAGERVSPVVVAVLDQRHPVTQCLPAFVHEGEVGEPGAPGLETAAAAHVLAGVLPAPSSPSPSSGGDGSREKDPPPALHPAVWTVARRRGRVLVSRLERGRGPSRGLVSTIVARAAQWAGGGAVTVVAAGEYRLAAELARDELPRGLGSIEGLFRGRQIAPFMTWHGADWLTREEREREEEPERLLDRLAIPEGATVVDLGAGNGYFSLRLARRVAPAGKVLAVDIQKEMLELLRARAAEAGIANVELVLAEPADPKLPAAAVDLVLMVDVYHELSHPRKVMAAVRRSLATGGRVVLVEYRGEDPRVPIKPLHRMLERQAVAEMESLGFRHLRTDRFLPRQHVLVFGAAE